MSKLPEELRDYSFPDAHLKQLADSKCIFVQRDIAQFNSRGVTNNTVAALQVMISNFSNTADDKEAVGTVSIMVATKDKAAENLRVKIRTIRTAAQNVHGEESVYYRIYGFEGMDKLSDEFLFRMGRRVSRVTSAQLQALAPENITNVTVTELNALINVFDNAIDTVEDAMGQRDLVKQDRIKKGNIVFKEMSRLCNIGQDLFASTDEAKYNDYIIYNTESGEPPVEPPPPGA